MEPAAVLVGAFQIQRRRPFQVVAVLQHEGMGGAGIKPDVQNIHHLFVIFGIMVVAQKPGRIGRKPGVGAFALDRLDDALEHHRVAQRLAGFLVDEDGDRYAPGALARHAPIWTGLDHVAKAFLPRRRHEAGFLDGFQGLVAEPRLFHGNEPLGGVAEDQRRLRAPTVRIAVRQFPPCQQAAGVLNGIGEGVIDLVDVLAGEQRHVIEETAVLADRLGHLDSVGLAQFPVVGPVPRRDVDDAGAFLGGGETGGQRRHVEIVTLAGQGMAADGAFQVRALENGDHVGRGDTEFGERRFQAGLGDDQLFSDLGKAAFCRFLDFDDGVIDVRAIGDGAVAGYGPRRRRPDDDGRRLDFGLGSLGDGEAHVDGGRGMVVVFDFGLGQGRLFDRRPHHRLGAPVERPVHQELAQLADDLGFGREAHGRVGVVPIADDAEALEFLALDVDPLLGEFPAFAAEFDDRHLVLVFLHLAVLFLDLPFDGKAVAVPAGDVIGIPAQHLLRAHDDVLEDLVERVADMQMPVGVGRTVVEDEFFLPLGGLAVQGLDVHVLPPGEDFGLKLRQTGLHGKAGLGQEHRRFVIGRH